MFGKKSEEKKFKKLTEKDIQERLYGFHRQTDMAGTPVPSESEVEPSSEKIVTAPPASSESNLNFNPSPSGDLSSQEEGPLAEEGQLSVETETKPQTDLFEEASEADLETVLDTEDEGELAALDGDQEVIEEELESDLEGPENSIELLKERIQKRNTGEKGLKIDTTPSEETELPDVTDALSDGADSSSEEQRTFIFNQEKQAEFWEKLEGGIEGFVKWVRQSPLTFAGIVGGLVILVTFFSIKWMVANPALEKPAEASKPEITVAAPILKLKAYIKMNLLRIKVTVLDRPGNTGITFKRFRTGIKKKFNANL